MEEKINLLDFLFEFFEVPQSCTKLKITWDVSKNNPEVECTYLPKDADGKYMTEETACGIEVVRRVKKCQLIEIEQ